MAKNFLVNIDLNGNELQNAVIENLSADPLSPSAWQIFYDTDDNKIKVYNGTAFKKIQDEDDAGSPTLGGLTDTALAGLAAWNILLYDGTDSWDNKVMSGDITINSSWVTTIWSGAVDFAMLASAGITTDLSSSASSSEIARADAIKTYVDAAVATADAFVVKWGINCSTNPNYPAADAGHSYRVTVAGKIGWASGVNVSVGDLIICFTDSTATWDHATVGANWIVEQNNLEAASTTVAGYVELATTAETEAKTDTERAVTPASLATFARKYTATIWDAAATSIVVTHGLGSQYVTAQAFIEATSELAEVEITQTSATQTTFGFGTAPALNAIRVVITG